jgi:hypothetical protein
MALGRIGGFFGDEWDDTLDSIKSAPGAFGNIFIASLRQVRLVDALALTLVFAGWLWLLVTLALGHEMHAGRLLLGFLPTIAWMVSGAIGALIFEIGGIGPRVLRYWESYVLILFFSLLGTVSLRLALNPKDRVVYRNPPSTGV